MLKWYLTYVKYRRKHTHKVFVSCRLKQNLLLSTHINFSFKNLFVVLEISQLNAYFKQILLYTFPFNPVYYHFTRVSKKYYFYTHLFELRKHVLYYLWVDTDYKNMMLNTFTYIPVCKTWFIYGHWGMHFWVYIKPYSFKKIVWVYHVSLWNYNKCLKSKTWY